VPVQLLTGRVAMLKLMRNSTSSPSVDCSRFARFIFFNFFILKASSLQWACIIVSFPPA
jgi:hypothetical protein